MKSGVQTVATRERLRELESEIDRAKDELNRVLTAAEERRQAEAGNYQAVAAHWKCGTQNCSGKMQNLPGGLLCCRTCGRQAHPNNDRQIVWVPAVAGPPTNPFNAAEAKAIAKCRARIEDLETRFFAARHAVNS